MHNRLQTAKSIDEVLILLLRTLTYYFLAVEIIKSESWGLIFVSNRVEQVIQHHDYFLERCLRECLLLLPELLKVNSVPYILNIRTHGFYLFLTILRICTIFIRS